jgi:hypothetical protein
VPESDMVKLNGEYWNFNGYLISSSQIILKCKQKLECVVMYIKTISKP